MHSHFLVHILWKAAERDGIEGAVLVGGAAALGMYIAVESLGLAVSPVLWVVAIGIGAIVGGTGLIKWIVNNV